MGGRERGRERLRDGGGEREETIEKERERRRERGSDREGKRERGDRERERRGEGERQRERGGRERWMGSEQIKCVFSAGGGEEVMVGEIIREK